MTQRICSDRQTIQEQVSPTEKRSAGGSETGGKGGRDTGEEQTGGMGGGGAEGLQDQAEHTNRK